MSSELREIPVYGNATYAMEVEVDDDGEYWLTPDQIAILQQMRVQLQFSMSASSALEWPTPDTTQKGHEA